MKTGIPFPARRLVAAAACGLVVIPACAQEEVVRMGDDLPPGRETTVTPTCLESKASSMRAHVVRGAEVDLAYALNAHLQFGVLITVQNKNRNRPLTITVYQTCKG